MGGPGGKGNSKLEEVKIDPSGNTVIDLNSHKNNIRHRSEENVQDDEKKKVKCKYYPNCKLGEEECPFFHPKEECTYFPKCTRGEKCLYIHPNVKDLIIFYRLIANLA